MLSRKNTKNVPDFSCTHGRMWVYRRYAPVILNLQSTCVIMHLASCSIINVVVQNVSTTKPEMKIVLPFKDHIAASVVGR